jgi:hypothetical protein
VRPSERQPPVELPRALLPLFGTAEEKQRWLRLLFVKYLVLTGKLGKGDMEAER